MRTLAVLPILVAGAVAALSVGPRAGESKKDEPPRRAVGIDKRVPWTTSHVKGSPEPPAPYRSEVAFPKLKFFEPLDLANAPGSDRLFVAERPGKIWSFVNDPKTARRDLLIDLKKTVYAFTFHPQFARNGYLYVTYI